MDKENLIEKLANLEHEQWMDWSKSISNDLYDLITAFDKLQDTLIGMESVGTRELQDFEDKINGLETRLKRWEELWVSYNELSEDMKEEDRVYARKILELLIATGMLKESV